MSYLIRPANHSVVDTHTDIQNRFINSIKEQGIDAALEWLLSEKNGMELSYPVSVRFVWSAEGTIPYIFELSESEDFEAPFMTETNDPFFDLNNLKVGQTYYWRVNKGAHYTFRTADNSFRFIKIDGARNVRDLGGIHIKQGMLYRGSEINKEYRITEIGKREWNDRLHIKSEVNLRKEGICTDGISCAGDKVQYKYLPYRPYLEIFEEVHRQEIVYIMDFLADENNYPIYFHCLGGADRTGMIALFLRALAGESEEDIFIDYELTSLSSYAYGLAEGVRALGFRNHNNDYFQKFYERFRLLEGETVKEKTESFLLDCGVLPKTMAKIQSILRK